MRKPFLLSLLLVVASISRRWPDLRVGSSVLFRIAKRGDPMALLGGGPRLVLLFSGKRKSGKDFVTEALQSRCRRGREEGRRVGKGAGEMPHHVTRGVC